MFNFLLILSILISPPNPENAVIIGRAECIYQDLEWNGETKVGYFVPKYEVTKNEVTTENISLYLIREDYCGVKLPLSEKIKYAESKYITKRGGGFTLYGRPNVDYRIYIAVGLENHTWRNIKTVQGYNKMNKIKIYNRIYK